MQEPRVEHDAARSRFVIKTPEGDAMLLYDLHGTRMIIRHTEVPPELEGHGLGAALAKTALEYARANQLKVILVCPYVTKYVERHPEYQDLVTPIR